MTRKKENYNQTCCFQIEKNFNKLRLKTEVFPDTVITILRTQTQPPVCDKR